MLLLFNISIVVQAQDLKQYQWTNRIIVLFGSESDRLLIEQKKLLAANTKALLERDIKMIVADKNLRQKLNLKNDFKGLLLIGKDGGIKFKQEFIVPPEKIFTIIDGMPMRKAELQINKH